MTDRLHVAMIDATGRVGDGSRALLDDGSWGEAAGGESAGGLDVAVEAYGAVGDGVTDDTAAIQAAIDAVITAGGGRVRFSDTTYLVAGALNTAAQCRAQLIFKNPTLPDETVRVRTVLLEGPRGKNAILQSTLTGQTYSSSHGIPSVLGGPTREQAGYGYMRNLAVRVKNLNVVVPNNPSISGWNFEQTAHVSLEECTVWPIGNQGITLFASSTVLEPTHMHACGVILPGYANYEQHWVKNVHVTGFFIGIMAAEHAVIDGYTAYRNVIALGLPLHQHLMSARGLSVAWCRYSIATANPRAGLYNSRATYGSKLDGAAAVINIDEFDVEDAINTTGEWATTAVHIYDPGNLIRGVIRGMRTLGGFSAASLDTDPFIVDGAANTEIINDILNPEGSGGSGSSLTVQDENGNIATGVTQLDFQGANVTAAAGTGEVVVTVGSSSSTTYREVLMESGTSPPAPLESSDGGDWLYGEAP